MISAQVDSHTPVSRYANNLKDGWPEQLPYVTRVEAKRAEARLYKKFGVLDNGRKRTRCSFGFGAKSWVCLSGDSNGLDRGWRRLVHDISHDIHRFRYPNKTPHGSFHSTIEKELIAYVVGQTNWLQGGLRPKTKAKLTVVDKRAQRLAKTQKMVALWTRKLKLAKTKLAGYTADERRQAKALATPYAAPERKERKKPVRTKLSQREAKRQAVDLANEFDIELDYIVNENKHPRAVYPPTGLYKVDNDDPYEGDHTVEQDCWLYILDFVCEYVEAILLKGQAAIDRDAE